MSSFDKGQSSPGTAGGRGESQEALLPSETVGEDGEEPMDERTGPEQAASTSRTPDPRSSVVSSIDSMASAQEASGEGTSSGQGDTEETPTSTASRPRKRRKKKFYLAPSNPLSQVLFLWVWRLMWLIQHAKDLKHIHMTLYTTETCSVCGDRLQEKWDREFEKRQDRASLMRALTKAFGPRYALLSIWKIFWVLFTWVGAYWILKRLVDVQDDRQSSSTNTHWVEGHVYALGLFLTWFLGSICFHQLAMQSTRVGIQIRGALMVMIYRKSLRLSYLRGGVGDVVNLISNDCNRIAEACVNAHYLWASALEAIVDLGLASIPSNILIVFIILPLQYFLARRASAISYETTSLITKRVRLMSEMLTAIKLIKFYAWEDYYLQKVDKARKKEVDKERMELLSKIAGFMMIFVAPVLCMLLSLLVTWFLTSTTPSASMVFSLLALYNTLRYPLLLLPSAERTITGAQISIARLEEYYKQPEVDKPSEILSPPSESPELVMKILNAQFIWDGDLEHPHIRDLNLDLKRGQIVAVVGDGGSGKSLLAALMGQLKRTQGQTSVYGSFGYVPQEPWLIDASIRDNIMFGLEIDENLYNDAIRLCGLTRDLLLLSNGDETFVNEINLSLNQKQRISLARCICHQPDLVLLEDCFGDFEQTQAKRLFRECIKTELRKTKCIVMVTQQRKFLSECDLILVMKSGRIVERGTYLELKARQVNFSAWVSDLHPIDDDPTGVFDRAPKRSVNPLSPLRTSSSSAAPQNGLSPGAQIRHRMHRPSPLATASVINAEETPAETGPTESDPNNLEPNQRTIRQLQDLNAGSTQSNQIDEATISKMIERHQSAVLTGTPSRPPPNFANQDIVTRTIEANQLTVHDFSAQTIKSMTETGTLPNSGGLSRPNWFTPYFIYIKEANVAVLAWVAMVVFLILPAVRLISDVWLSFLVENRYPFKTSIIVYGCFALFISIGVLARGYGFSYAVLVKNISLHNRVLKAVLRAPMSFYDTTPLGNILSFFARHLFLIDEFLPEAALQVITFGPVILGTIILVSAIVPWVWATLPIYIMLGWPVINISHLSEERLQEYEASNKSPLFAHLSTTLEGLFSIRLYNVQDRFDTYNRTLIDADHKALYSLLSVKAFMALYLDIIACLFIYLAALFVVLFNLNGATTGLALTNAMQLVLFVQWLVRMVGELHSSMNSVLLVTSFAKSIPREFRDKDPTKIKPPPQWPQRGEIDFKNVTLRYHQYGVAVLKSVSFHIYEGEKIAIVGRSGSGKTTLLMSLLRMTQPVEGDILIDDVDTNSVDLKTLRSKMAIIPQQPVLFSGTIRSNLDPFGHCTDGQIWEALKAVHLGEKIKEMPAQLDTTVTENGKTFSSAERQLFSIARAVLIQTKIVVIDEPSVSEDTETDDLIREVIKDNFRDRTVIILANRFRLIVQMDRILVMDHGKVVEFDTPLALLDNPKSKFSLMISQTGDVDPTRLRQLALLHTETQKQNSNRLMLSPASAGAGGVQLEKGWSRESNSHTTRSLESQHSAPRSLSDIFNPPPASVKRTASTRSSASNLSSTAPSESVELMNMKNSVSQEMNRENNGDKLSQSQRSALVERIKQQHSDLKD